MVTATTASTTSALATGSSGIFCAVKATAAASPTRSTPYQSGMKPAAGAKPSHSGMVAARAIQSAPSAAKARASPSSPLAIFTGSLFPEQVAVQLFLAREEVVELLAGDRRRLRDVVRVVLLHRRGVVGLGHHAFPIDAR